MREANIMTTIGSYIRRLRELRGRSQEATAKVLDISRTTYMQLEKGERDLAMQELHILARFFDVSEVGILNRDIPSGPGVQLDEKPRLTKQIPEIRINVPQENIDKFQEVLLYIL